MNLIYPGYNFANENVKGIKSEAKNQLT